MTTTLEDPEKYIREKTIFCFWTGTNPMTEKRARCFEGLKQKAGCKVVCITPDTLPPYILPDHPLHEAYQYLSEVHKADYLRTYFMNFYGGGYSDIKSATAPWPQAFQDILDNPDKWMNGYREVGEHGVAYHPVKYLWRQLIGNGAYIARPQTLLTKEWYTSMLAFLDSKLDALKQNPSRNYYDCVERGCGYPIEWNEMLGRIFHRVSAKYFKHLLYSVPIVDLDDYR
jgi:hypothetical protein